jgi:hypothetical protein
VLARPGTLGHPLAWRSYWKPASPPGRRHIARAPDAGRIHLPSAEQHPEVYEHAVKLLIGDAHKVIAEEIKTPVVTLFTAWRRRRGGSEAAV